MPCFLIGFIKDALYFFYREINVKFNFNKYIIYIYITIYIK